MRLTMRFVFFALAIAIIGYCDFYQNRANMMQNETNTVQVSRSKRVPIGMWGGKHIALEVTERAATVEYDCAHGSINEPMVVDGEGNFAVKGDYIAERRGPQRVGESSNARPARYIGSVSGRTMTLKVVLTDKEKEIGTFTLTHGQAPQIVKCL
jgi:hypothetical protein